MKDGSPVVYGAIVRAWTQITGLALFALGARTLGIADFGVFTLAAVFINVVQSLLYSGVYEFVMRSKPDQRLDHTAFVLNFGISALGALMSAGLGWVIAGATGQPAVFHLAAWMAPSALIAGITAWHEAQVLRSRRYSLYYINWAITETVAAVAGALLLLAGARLNALIGYRYLQTTLVLLGYLVFGPVSYGGEFRLSAIPGIIRFAGPIYASRIMGTLSSYGADLVIGLILGPSATGLYRMANRIVASATEAMFQPLRLLSWVRSVRARGSAVRVSLGLLPLIQLAAMLLWPAGMILSYVSEDILRIGLGPNWTAASEIVAVLFFSKCVGVMEVFVEPLLANIGAGRWLLLVRSLSIAALGVGLVCLVPLGVAYTGFATLAPSMILTAAVLPILLRAVGPRRLTGALATGALLTIAIGAVFVAGTLARGLAEDQTTMLHFALAGIACAMTALVLFSHRRALTQLRR